MTNRCCPLSVSDAAGIVCGGSAFVDVTADVYDGMAFVLPLDEFGTGTVDEYKDRTRNGLHGTGGDGGDLELVPTQDLGVFCALSQHTDGRQFITLPPDQLSERQGFTVSMWTRIETFYKPRTWFSRGYETEIGETWVFAFGHSFLNALSVSVQLIDRNGTVQTYELYGDTTLEQNRWYHVAASWEPGVGLKVYLDGVLDGQLETTETMTTSLTNGSYLARWNEAAIPTGNLQEVRLHPVVRSAGYLLAEHDNYCAEGFFVVGGEEDTIMS